MTSIKALYRFNLSPTSPKSPAQASDPSQKVSIRCPRSSVSEQDFCCHRRKTADDKDIEQIKRTMLERVESIEPRIRDYAEEWHINIFRQKDLRWRYKKKLSLSLHMVLAL